MKYRPLALAACAVFVSATSCSMGHKSEAGTEAAKTETQSVTGTAAATEDDGSFTKSPDGLDYKIVTKGAGTVAPKPGDFAEMHVKFRIGDTVMINTIEMNQGQPVQMAIQAPSIQGDLMQGLTMLKAGDSAVFRMNMDTFALRAHQPKPTWAKPGDYAVWEVKMVSVKSKTQVEAEAKAHEAKQNAIDDKLLQEHFKAKGIKNVKKTPSGIYYVVHKPGAGISPKAGQTVTVNYTGQTLGGEKFDSNTDPSFNHIEPFSFSLGQHSVIAGWDEGVALMKKGMSATFYLPSSKAYGERGQAPKIAPNAILVFDIELLSFK